MNTITVDTSDQIPPDYTGIVQYTNGTKKYFKNKVLHREEGPCTTCKDCLVGSFELCSKPGPAIIDYDGTKRWCFNGKIHREDGPAVEYARGDKFWLLNGQYHRLDGPASLCRDGTKHWFIYGKECSEEQHALYIDLLKLKALYKLQQT